jgi:hypothetical protein
MKIVAIFDEFTKQIVCCRFIVEAAGCLGVSVLTVQRHILSKKPIKNRYFVSVHRLDGSKKQAKGRGSKK